MPARSIAAVALAALAGLWMAPITVLAQAPGGTGSRDQPAVFRSSTELVQTDVMVFDKDGAFVNDLRVEDFELRIDGKVRAVRFLERVVAGSTREAVWLAGAEVNRVTPPTDAPSRRGRTVVFYLDDLHLDLAGVRAVQRVIGDFIDEGMSEADEVAVVSASGQAGFLEQLTNNKTVLRRALQRITVRPNSMRDLEKPAMSDYQALVIDRSDRDTIGFFVQETLRMNPGMTRDQAEQLVVGRSRVLLQQATRVTAQTLVGLEKAIRSSNGSAGRKLVILFSGGFMLDSSERTNQLRRLTNVAARQGAVIYSVDARGLESGSAGANETAAALSDRLARLSMLERTSTQDGLNVLARDTGGKALFNSNALGAGVARALEETSRYYVLAWEPDSQPQKAPKFREIAVAVVGRPDVSVRVRGGFFDVELPSGTRPAKADKALPVAPAVEETPAPLSQPPNEAAIPVALSLNYVLTDDRKIALTWSLHIAPEALSFTMENGKSAAPLRIAGQVYNDRGQGGTQFDEVVTLGRDDSKRDSALDATVSHQVLVESGLYLVQVGVRDERSGRVGATRAWIEIPNLVSGGLALSSVNVGQRRISRDTELRFLVFVYNAARGTGGTPDVALQVELSRDDRTIAKTPLKQLPTRDVDPERLPYAANISLANLPTGQYVLDVTVIDRVSGTTAAQQTTFDIVAPAAR